MLTEGSEVRAFVRSAAAAHAAGAIGVALGAADLLLEREGLLACASATCFAVYLGAVWIKRRWLKPYIKQPEAPIGRRLAGNLPSMVGFEQALRHAATSQEATAAGG